MCLPAPYLNDVGVPLCDEIMIFKHYAFCVWDVSFRATTFPRATYTCTKLIYALDFVMFTSDILLCQLLDHVLGGDFYVLILVHVGRWGIMWRLSHKQFSEA